MRPMDIQARDPKRQVCNLLVVYTPRACLAPPSRERVNSILLCLDKLACTGGVGSKRVLSAARHLTNVASATIFDSECGRTFQTWWKEQAVSPSYQYSMRTVSALGVLLALASFCCRPSFRQRIAQSSSSHLKSITGVHFWYGSSMSFVILDT